MPGNPTGGRLRLKAFCPMGNPPFVSACPRTVARARRGQLSSRIECEGAGRVSASPWSTCLLRGTAAGGKSGWTAVGREAEQRDERQIARCCRSAG